MPCQYGRRTDDGDGARMDMVKPKRIMLLPRLASCLCCLYSIDPSIRHLLSLVPLNHFFRWFTNESCGVDIFEKNNTASREIGEEHS